MITCPELSILTSKKNKDQLTSQHSLTLLSDFSVLNIFGFQAKNYALFFFNFGKKSEGEARVSDNLTSKFIGATQRALMTRLENILVLDEEI